MYSFWLLAIGMHLIIFITIAPYINESLPPLARHSRMRIYHRLFSTRCAVLSYLNIIPVKIDSDSNALDEMIKLYFPKIKLEEKYTNKDLETLRYHSRKMLSSLHPPVSSSCRIENHFIFYNDKYFNISSIHYNQIDHWNTSNQSLVLYFHGGGFFFGNLDTYSGFECHLARDLNMTILHVNFGLIPEYPLEKIIEDAIDVYNILHHIDPYINQRMIGMGDSSGGMLWIYLLQWIASNNKPLPQGVVLHSPWINLDVHNINAKIDWITYISTDFLFAARALVNGNNTKWFYWTYEVHEKISLKSDSFERFPPLYITAGSNELFTYQARFLVGKLKLADVEVVYEEGEGLMHTYALFHLWSSKARSAQKNVRQWIQKRLSTNLTLMGDVKTFVNTSAVF